MKTRFSFLGVQPPSNLFVINGQALQVYLYNICQVPADVRIITRILRPDGEMKEITSPVIAVNGVDPTFLIIPLTECYILSCTVVCDTAAIWPGHLFAIVNLLNSVNVSAFVIAQLIAGYVSPRTSPTYPTTPIKLSTDVLPIQAVIFHAEPAPGAAAIYTAPINRTSKVVMIRFSLTTAAGGAVRRAKVDFGLGGIGAGTVHASVTQAGGLAVIYQFTTVIYTPLVAAFTRENLQSNLQLYPADTYLMTCDGIVAADQINDAWSVHEEQIFV